MSRKFGSTRFLLLLLLPVLASCNGLDHREFLSHKPAAGISTTSASSQMVVTFEDGKQCFAPPPDAATDTGSDVAIALPLSVSNTNAGAGNFQDQVPLGGRNPNVLITRQIMFESCLAEQRFELTREERILHWQRTLQMVALINQRSLEGLSVRSDNIAETTPTLNYQPFNGGPPAVQTNPGNSNTTNIHGGPYYER